jgi:hypothetical protein
MRLPQIRVSARQRLRAGGAGRARDGGLVSWRIQHGRRWPSARRSCRNCCRCWPCLHAPDLVPQGAMGLRRLQRLHDGGTNAHGRADPTRADHDGDVRHAAGTGRGSSRRASRWASEDGARLWPTRGRGVALADVWAGEPARKGHGSGRRAAGRFRRGHKGSAAGGRWVHSWRTDSTPS